MIDEEELKTRIDFSVHPLLGLFVPRKGKESRDIMHGATWAEQVKATRAAAHGDYPFYASIVLADESHGRQYWGAIGVKHMQGGYRYKLVLGVPMPGFCPLNIMQEIAEQLMNTFKYQEKDTNDRQRNRESTGSPGS